MLKIFQRNGHPNFKVIKQIANFRRKLSIKDKGQAEEQTYFTKLKWEQLARLRKMLGISSPKEKPKPKGESLDIKNSKKDGNDAS